jgi:hypothetical protein
MFDRIEQIITDCPATERVSPNRKSPTEGLIYFSLVTDDTTTPQLRYFAPEASALIVDNGNIVEFDIRLGKWHPKDDYETMNQLRKTIKNARREYPIPPLDIDSGGGYGFVPHIRHTAQTQVPANPFADFLVSLVTEVKFLQTHRQETPSETRS